LGHPVDVFAFRAISPTVHRFIFWGMQIPQHCRMFC